MSQVGIPQARSGAHGTQNLRSGELIGSAVAKRMIQPRRAQCRQERRRRPRSRDYHLGRTGAEMPQDDPNATPPPANPYTSTSDGSGPYPRPWRRRPLDPPPPTPKPPAANREQGDRSSARFDATPTKGPRAITPQQPTAPLKVPPWNLSSPQKRKHPLRPRVVWRYVRVTTPPRKPTFPLRARFLPHFFKGLPQRPHVPSRSVPLMGSPAT